jgi:hypothetical protein
MGVNLTDLRQLDWAKNILKEPLEYEPGNELAKHELIVIARLRLRWFGWINKFHEQQVKLLGYPYFQKIILSLK